jgi:hypothetical protein
MNDFIIILKTQGLPLIEWYNLTIFMLDQMLKIIFKTNVFYCGKFYLFYKTKKT